MAYHPDDMYINDSDKLYGCNKNVKFGGKWDSEMDTSKRRKSTFADDLIILLNKALYIKYSLDKKLEYISLDIKTNILKRLQDLSGAKNDRRKSDVN